MKMVASLYRAVTEQYNEYMNSGDPRVTSWPLISGPTPMLVLIALYLIFVKLIGPAWMRNKKPFDLRYAMIIYNVALVCLNIYVVATMISILIGENKTLICRMDKDPYNPDAIKVAELGWLFYILKFVEFFDTIFFVLRKKDRNISALHVVHHSVTPIGTWISFRVVPVTGDTYLDMLQIWLFPQLNKDSTDYIFQQDGAPPHWNLNVCHHLNKVLPHRWIYRSGPKDLALTNWPPRSPDLTPSDFFLLGVHKGLSLCNLYQQTCMISQNALLQLWRRLTQDMLDQV